MEAVDNKLWDVLEPFLRDGLRVAQTRNLYMKDVDMDHLVDEIIRNLKRTDYDLFMHVPGVHQ